LDLFDLALIWESLDGKLKVKDAKEGKEKAVVVGEKEASGSGEKAAAAGNLPCMDRLREELSCAVRVVLWFRLDHATCNSMLYGLLEMHFVQICLEICFEPSTTPCGHR